MFIEKNTQIRLRLPLKRKWFEMTNPEGKTEDYREINNYWCSRLLELDEETQHVVWSRLIEDLVNRNTTHQDVYQCLSYYGVRFKKFKINTMTLGYPKSYDKSRVKEFTHKGIEIRTGKPEWGAEPNKLYFVIMHGGCI